MSIQLVNGSRPRATQLELDLSNYNTKGEKLNHVYEHIIKAVEDYNKFLYSNGMRYENERKKFVLEIKNAKIKKQTQKEWSEFVSSLNSDLGL
jgi:translation initiation factor IF-3